MKGILEIKKITSDSVNIRHRERERERESKIKPPTKPILNPPHYLSARRQQ